MLLIFFLSLLFSLAFCVCSLNTTPITNCSTRPTSDDLTKTTRREREKWNYTEESNELLTRRWLFLSMINDDLCASINERFRCSVWTDSSSILIDIGSSPCNSIEPILVLLSIRHWRRTVSSNVESVSSLSMLISNVRQSDQGEEKIFQWLWMKDIQEILYRTNI